MIDRRSLLRNAAFLLPAAATALSFVSTARAAEALPFTSAAFETAKAAGRPILIDVSAPWCPTCKAQRPILSQIEAQPRYKDLAVFSVDFDSQKDVLRTLGVRMQSTLICFKGAHETARSTGDTNSASLARLLETTL